MPAWIDDGLTSRLLDGAAELARVNAAMGGGSYLLLVSGPPLRHRALVGGTLAQAKAAAEAMLDQ